MTPQTRRFEPGCVRQIDRMPAAYVECGATLVLLCGGGRGEREPTNSDGDTRREIHGRPSRPLDRRELQAARPLDVERLSPPFGRDAGRPAGYRPRSPILVPGYRPHPCGR